MSYRKLRVRRDKTLTIMVRFPDMSALRSGESERERSDRFAKRENRA